MKNAYMLVYSPRSSSTEEQMVSDNCKKSRLNMLLDRVHRDNDRLLATSQIVSLPFIDFVHNLSQMWMDRRSRLQDDERQLEQRMTMDQSMIRIVYRYVPDEG